MLTKLGRERVHVEELAGWLAGRLVGKVAGFEVLHDESEEAILGPVALSFRLVVGGFVQESVDSELWDAASPARQKADAERLFLMLKGRIDGAERSREGRGAGSGGDGEVAAVG